MSSFLRISLVTIAAVNNDPGGKRSRSAPGSGAKQGPQEGRILPEEGAGNQETETEAFKQVKYSRQDPHE